MSLSNLVRAVMRSKNKQPPADRKRASVREAMVSDLIRPYIAYEDSIIHAYIMEIALKNPEVLEKIEKAHNNFYELMADRYPDLDCTKIWNDACEALGRSLMRIVLEDSGVIAARPFAESRGALKEKPPVYPGV